MRFVLWHRFDVGGDEVTWRPEELEAHYRYVNDMKQSLTETGELVAFYALAALCQARIVRSDGGVTVVANKNDSIHTASNCWVVDCVTSDRAIDIAKRISAAPGAGGLPLNYPVELHPASPFGNSSPIHDHLRLMRAWTQV